MFERSKGNIVRRSSLFCAVGMLEQALIIFLTLRRYACELSMLHVRSSADAKIYFDISHAEAGNLISASKIPRKTIAWREKEEGEKKERKKEKERNRKRLDFLFDPYRCTVHIKQT